MYTVFLTSLWWNMKTSETKQSNWQKTLNASTVIVAALTLGFTALQYFKNVQNEQFKPIWSMQVESYETLVEESNKSSFGNASDRVESLKKLNILYGKLLMVGDGNMVGITSYLLDSLKLCIAGNQQECNLLPYHSEKIAKCARLSLTETWDQSFNRLPQLPESFNLSHECFNGKSSLKS